MKIAWLPEVMLEAAQRVSKRLRRLRLAAVYGSEPATVDPVIDRLQAEALREEW